MATACLTVAASLTVPMAAAHAEPTPSAAEARKKLTKLNEQVEQLVEKYNQVGEELKIAKRKLKATKKAGADEQKTFNELRQKIAEMAAAAYKNGDTGGVVGFAAADDPQKILDQSAVISHLSRNRSSELDQFLASTQRLRREQAQAQAAYDEVVKKAKELKQKKAEVEKSIAAQKKLLAKLGETADKPGTGSGATYNGPASGSARTAIQFAYAQLGKPYQYGAEGPNSYDCSGLTMRAWGAAGVNLPRVTNSQYAATRRVSFDALQPGDLVFFNNLGHVGLYIGGGNMIHAPRTGKNVEIVSITSGYYRTNFYGAGRV
ncbi:C40 family peptidase [Actinomadura keratinilytica]|uniref:C40 family peptidase n=1 Tax=Actinomadura keratinilytica TaxID=547461 RepID=A0ABP7YUW5_9ACTN